MYVRIKSPLGKPLCEVDSSKCITVGEILDKVTEQTRANNVFLRPVFWDNNTGLDPNEEAPKDMSEYVLCYMTPQTKLKKFETELIEVEYDPKQGELVRMILQGTILFVMTGIMFGFVFK